jgi:SP family xylose:H+ symportor-like MFS transporter
MIDENPTLIAHFNHGFPFYLFAFFCIVQVITVWKFFPETKGHSLEEIEHFWDIPASALKG